MRQWKNYSSEQQKKLLIKVCIYLKHGYGVKNSIQANRDTQNICSIRKIKKR